MYYFWLGREADDLYFNQSIDCFSERLTDIWKRMDYYWVGDFS